MGIVVTTATSPFLASARQPSNSNVNPTRQPMARRMIGSILDMLGGGGSELISPEKALKGRSQKMANIDNLRHYVLGNKLEEVPEGYEVAVFGNGCFWGSEKGTWRMPKGIHSTAVGYCAGFTPNPTYEEACSTQTGHTEGVRVVFNPDEVSYVDILRMFWESHDPTQYMGQGNDRGSQYRSGIYFFNDDQRRLIEPARRRTRRRWGDGRSRPRSRPRRTTTSTAACGTSPSRTTSSTSPGRGRGRTARRSRRG